MTIIICAITAGILLGWLDVFNYKTKLWLNRVSTVCLFIILLCLGAKIGCDKEMLAKIPVLGQQAFLLGSSAKIRIAGEYTALGIIPSPIARSPQASLL